MQLLWRTPYGFLAEVHHRSGTVFFDGTAATTVACAPTRIKISPDGRYAGWIDVNGPRRLRGRPAQLVVVDLRTGGTVMRNHDNMGGPTDDLDDPTKTPRSTSPGSTGTTPTGTPLREPPPGNGPASARGDSSRRPA